MTRCALPLCLALLAIAMGCAEEERVVGVRGGIYNMPGAVSNLDYQRPGESSVASGAWANLQLRFMADHPDLVVDPSNPMRAVGRDDPTRIVLLLYSPRHLVINLHDAIAAGEWELIQEQIIAQQVKDELRSSLRDPYDALRALSRKRRSVIALLKTMPDGDQTPGLTLTPLGGNQFRLSAPGGTTLDLQLRHLDMVIEGNQFRLLAVR